MHQQFEPEWISITKEELSKGSWTVAFPESVLTHPRRSIRPPGSRKAHVAGPLGNPPKAKSPRFHVALGALKVLQHDGVAQNSGGGCKARGVVIKRSPSERVRRKPTGQGKKNTLKML